jgi:hypothetical protein
MYLKRLKIIWIMSVMFSPVSVKRLCPFILRTLLSLTSMPLVLSACQTDTASTYPMNNSEVESQSPYQFDDSFKFGKLFGYSNLYKKFRDVGLENSVENSLKLYFKDSAAFKEGYEIFSRGSAGELKGKLVKCHEIKETLTTLESWLTS